MIFALDAGDDAVGLAGLGVVHLDEPSDGGLEIDARGEHAALEAPLGEFGEEGLDRVGQQREVGVKWKTKRGWRCSQARTFGF